MITPEQVDTFIEVYGKTRHQGAAQAAANISHEWIAQKKKHDPEFRARMAAATATLDGMVMKRAVNVVLHGAPREVVNTSNGEIVTLRSYCARTTLSYLENYCGWNSDRVSDSVQQKEVHLMAAPDQPVKLLDVMRQQVAADRGIQIEAPKEHAEPS